jgi:hypothetical protein
MMRGVVVAVVVCVSGAGCFSKPPPPDRLDGGGGSNDGSLAIDAPGSVRCTNWGLFSTQVMRVALESPADVIEPSLSSDETDLIYMASNVPSEATRVDTTMDFGQVMPLTSLIGSAVVESLAWLSPNRLTLYEIVSGGTLNRLTRTTLGDSFPTPDSSDVLVASDVQDATLVTDEHRLVYSTGGMLESIVYATMQPPVTRNLLSKTPDVVFSPSIGDHDRAIVWSESAQAMPTISDLWIGDLMDTQVTNQQKIGLPAMYYAGAILSNDGRTLYFTGASSSGSMGALYEITRPCMDGD